MKEFMMIFMHTPNADMQPTAEQMQASDNQWKDWIGGIAAQGKLVSGKQLGMESKTLMPGNVVTDGPMQS